MDKHNIEVLCWHGCSVPSEGVRQASRKNMTLTQSGSNGAMSCSFRQPAEVCLSPYGGFLVPPSLLWAQQISILKA